MSKHYLFFLGRDLNLSFAEVISYIRARKARYKVKLFKNKLAVIEIDKIDAKKAINDLGGTVKIAEEIKDISSLYGGSSNKITYTFWDNDDIGLEEMMKIHFKEEGLKAMRRKADQMNPSRDMHIDVEVTSFNKMIFKTVAVSNPKSYKARDEKRPNWDAKTVVSLRLAKILINLSEVSENKLLIDPFCGLGTIMQEALLMNVNVIGFEKDRLTSEKCTRNLEWLGKKYKGKWKIHNSDARRLSNQVKNADGAATEPYMGPYFKRVPNRYLAERIVRELETLYADVLRELRKAVKGKVAIIMPRFKTDVNKRLELDIKGILAYSGFKIDDSIPEIQYPLPYYHVASNIERFIYVLR